MDMACQYAIGPRDNIFQVGSRNDIISRDFCEANWGVRHTDTNSPGPGEFSKIAGLAVSAEYVFACDFLSGHVQVFRYDGSWVRMLQGSLQYPAQVGVMESRKQVVVRERTNTDLKVFCLHTGVWKHDLHMSICPSMFALSAEELFVEEEDWNLLHVFTLDGEFLRVFNLPGTLLMTTVRDFLWVRAPTEIVILRPDGTIVAIVPFEDSLSGLDEVGGVAVGTECSLMFTKWGEIFPICDLPKEAQILLRARGRGR